MGSSNTIIDTSQIYSIIYYNQNMMDKYKELHPTMGFVILEKITDPIKTKNGFEAAQFGARSRRAKIVKVGVEDKNFPYDEMCKIGAICILPVAGKQQLDYGEKELFAVNARDILVYLINEE